MKKIWLLLFVCLWFRQINAQEEMGYDSKFAAGGGFTPGWIKADLAAINEKMPGLGLGKLPESGFFATGGTGFISIPFIQNLRIGGMGLGGSVKNSALVNGFNKEAEYSVTMGGFTVEYTFPFIKNAAVSVGFILGHSTNSVEINQHRNEYTWDNLWSEVSDPLRQTQNIHRKISNSHYMFTPTINIDIPFYRFAAFRIGAGYKMAFSENWQYDNEIGINNIPSNLKSNLLFLQAGIFVGFFNY